MFSYSKIAYQLNQNARNQQIEQNQQQTLTSLNPVGASIESVGSALGGLLDIQPNNKYNEDEAEFQRQSRKKKKPKRKFGRQM